MTSVDATQYDKLPRLTAGELRRKIGEKEGGSNVVRLSLADILFGEDVIKNIDDGTEVVVKPVNFKGLMLFEKEYGDLTKIPGEDRLRNSPRELCRVLTILVNQDLDEKDKKTDDEVGRVITSENMGQVIRVVMTAIRPTPASATSLAEAAPTGLG